MSLVYKKEAFLKIIFIFAILSFLTTLTLPYQGEEGVYTLTSLEMWYHKEWIKPFLYGASYGRPPLYNWFIIFLSSLLGFEQILIAARMITAFATIGSSFVLFWLTRQLFRDKNIALFASVIYLSGDLLFRRGWLAYADPLFSLFVFSAISFLWVGLNKKHTFLLCLANLSLIAAFLSKALTAYCFYFIAFFVLFWRHENRRFLFSPLSIIFLLLSLLFPLFWNKLTADGAHSQEMIVDILSRLSSSETHFKHYIIKIITYPFSTLLYWMPASAIVLCLFWQAKKQNSHFLAKLKPDNQAFAFLSIAFWILFLNYIPYWLAPQNRIRYILPLYPFFAMIAGYIIYQAGDKIIRITNICLAILVLVKFLFGFFGYEFIEKNMRGNYLAIAEDIMQKTEKYPLYIDDDTAIGLSLASQINILRLSGTKPLTRCWNRETITKKGGGFHLINPNDLAKYQERHQNTRLFQEYKLGRNKIYLLCEGGACESVP